MFIERIRSKRRDLSFDVGARLRPVTSDRTTTNKQRTSATM
jgi:hypothetical protein